jgi:hypothetical protein
MGVKKAARSLSLGSGGKHEEYMQNFGWESLENQEGLWKYITGILCRWMNKWYDGSQ